MMQITDEMRRKAKETIEAKKNLRKVHILNYDVDLTKVPKYKRDYYIQLSEIGNSAVKAIKLKCYECCNYSKTEVKECPCRDCALYVYIHR